MKKLLLGSVAVAASVVLLGAPADAKGCGGYVNLAVWGCAPWDNNPPKKGVTPGYPAAKPTPQPARPIAQPAKPVVQPATGNRLVTDNGAGLANKGNSLVTDNGAGFANKGNSLVSDGGLGARGGNVINPANTSSSLISNRAGGVINPANTSSSFRR
jgi:hypothetical protein